MSLAPKILIALCFGPILFAADIQGNLLHADSSQSSRKTGDMAFWEEFAFWDAIKASKEPAEFEAYLFAYPQGRFARLAELRIKALKRRAESEPAEEIATPASNGDVPAEETSVSHEPEDPGRSDETTVAAPGVSSDSRFQDCDDCPVMSIVPVNDYPMGSDRHRPNEKPIHPVHFVQPFAIGVYEVTIREWDACLREGDCSFSPAASDDDRLPVSNLSWDDAQEYVGWLRKRTGKPYRLPTEAEWEYAASGGRTSVFWWGDEAGKGKANCSDCGSAWEGVGPAPVGSFEPNPFGLHDVHGNLWEWTMDCVNRSYKGAPTDGSAWLRGDCIARILRGGSWKLGADYMRTTRRNHYDRDVRYYLHGLRVALSLP